MKQLIAITSQNRKTVTGHAGRCRKFWLYPVDNSAVGEPRLVELSIEQTFHGTHSMPPGLEGMTTFISQGMGQGMFTRLQRLGVQPFITHETDLNAALQAYLRGEASGETEDEGHHHGEEGED